MAVAEERRVAAANLGANDLHGNHDAKYPLPHRYT